MSGTDGPLASLPNPPARRRWRQQKSTLISLGNYSLRKRGVSRYDWADPYGLAVSLTWPQFLVLLSAVYLAVNLLFASLYFVVPGVVANARPGSFTDDFFFSFETLATVGYGEMYPVTYYGHVVACLEVMCGIAFTAILTGLTFVRFSKPRPKYVFADRPVVAMHNGAPTLMLRIGNGGASVLADAKAKISILLAEQSAEGTRFRRAHELRLARSVIPVFPLSWTLMHEIDKRARCSALMRRPSRKPMRACSFRLRQGTRSLPPSSTTCAIMARRRCGSAGATSTSSARTRKAGPPPTSTALATSSRMKASS